MGSSMPMLPPYWLFHAGGNARVVLRAQDLITGGAAYRLTVAAQAKTERKGAVFSQQIQNCHCHNGSGWISSYSGKESCDVLCCKQAQSPAATADRISGTDAESLYSSSRSRRWNADHGLWRVTTRNQLWENVFRPRLGADARSLGGVESARGRTRVDGDPVSIDDRRLGRRMARADISDDGRRCRPVHHLDEHHRRTSRADRSPGLGRRERLRGGIRDDGPPGQRSRPTARSWRCWSRQT